MARSHGKLYTRVWNDPDWRELSGEAQRLYMLLLSQPKLTLCGTLDVSVQRWARMAADTQPDDVQVALDELEHRGYVLIDWDTLELAIRTFTKHDVNSTRLNINLIKGMWRAWEGLESDWLRSEIVFWMPQELWEKVEEEAPPEAVDFTEMPAPRTDGRDGWSRRLDGTGRPVENALSDETAGQNGCERVVPTASPNRPSPFALRPSPSDLQPSTFTQQQHGTALGPRAGSPSSGGWWA